MRDRSDQTPSTGGKAPPGAFIPVIDTEGESLAPDRILVRRTPIGYLCAGFGDASALLRFAFESYERDTSHLRAVCCRLDRSLAAEGLAKAQRLGLHIPLGEFNDPHLRRLAIAAALLKAGFDPNQTRDDHGRWTDEGGESGSAAPVNASTTSVGTISIASSVAAVADTISGSAWRMWAGSALDALPGIAARLAGPIGLLGGLILMPTNKSSVSDGTLPGRPDVAYHASEQELSLYHAGDAADQAPFFVSHADADGYYRDEQGNVVGRYVNGAFVLDPVGAAGVVASKAGDKGYEDETPEERRARIAALVEQARVRVRTADPEELCPDPAPDRPSAMSASQQAQDYQQQVTQLPYGVAFYLNGVNFDGCRYWGDKNMLEAKAEGFDQHITPDGEWKPYWKGWNDDVAQMTKQAAAAEAYGKIVEWHVAEKPIADILRAYAESHFSNVRVIWEPPLPKRRDKRDFFVQPPSPAFIEAMRRLASPKAPRFWIGIGANGRLTLAPALTADHP